MDFDKADKIRNWVLGVIWALVAIAVIILVKNWWQGL